MVPHKFSWLLLATWFFSASAFASESDDVKARFSAYWSAYVSGDYLGAAQMVHPEDLAGVQTEILPVFLMGLEASDPELKGFAAAFFEGVPDAKRKTLSGAESFVQLMRLLALASPEAMEVLQQSRMEIGAVSFDAQSPDSVILKYSLVIADISQSDFEQLSKVDGTWLLRTKEKPAATAAKFRKIFQR